MKYPSLLIFGLLVCFSCKETKTNSSIQTPETQTQIKNYPVPEFTITEANKLIELPLHCVTTEYPNKLSQVIGSDEDLKSPQTLHPVFYGCFDWHSAVHGYWSMVTLLDKFPELEKRETVKDILKKHLTKENIKTEVAYFKAKINNGFERTYGWAWLLKLAEALHNWNDPLAKELEQKLQPLTDIIIQKYTDFLPKLVYPIRVGEHPNTAFGLSFAFDYAKAVNNLKLIDLISNRAKDFYLNDENCPVTWEPSGYDFLSPCLEEADLMRRVLSKEEFLNWINRFLPQLKNKNYNLEVGKVGDRTDGKLVHLDGVNFSRAWCLYGIANQFPEEYSHLNNIGNKHVEYSYPNLIGDSYEGGHWLGSFAIYALQNSNSL